MSGEMRGPTLAGARELLALMIRSEVAGNGEPEGELEDLTIVRTGST